MSGPETNTERTRILLAPEDLIGFEINGLYRLDGLIGEGGMGVVFLAEQKSVGRMLALKLLKPGGLQGGKRIERFVRETAIISSLTHPNIVRVFDSGVADELGLHFIAMELVRGLSLDAILATHRLQPEFALEVIYQMCGALSEPHKQGITHRDIKPDNTLVKAMADDTIQVKVLDFGIARSHEGDQRVTTTGVVMGTPRYMAPETVEGGDIDARTDLYALGVMLFEMVVGHAPFTGITPMATMIQHVTERSPLIIDAFQDFPYPEISALAESLLAKSPDDRPESAQEVRKTIDTIRDHYRFGRVRVDSTLSPLDSLHDYLIERGDTGEIERRSLYNTGSWDEAEDYQLTHRMGGGSDEGRSADNLLPIPVETARRHLESRGRTLGDLQDSGVDIDVEGETHEYQSDQHATPATLKSKTESMEIEVLAHSARWAILVFVVVAIGLGIFVLWDDSPPVVDLSPDPVVQEPEKPVVKAPVAPVILEPSRSSVADLGMPDAGDASVQLEVQPEPVKVNLKKKPPKKKKLKVTGQEDEFEKGMEWLKTN